MLDLLEEGIVDANLEVIVKPGSEPILWTLGTEEEEERTADHTLSAPFIFTQDDEGLVSGRAVVQGPFEPGEYHLQLAGREVFIGLEDVAISTVATAGTPDAGPADPEPPWIQATTTEATRTAETGTWAPADAAPHGPTEPPAARCSSWPLSG